ncbi:Chorion peroxidase [Orchesella cincta]|uniref:Chorion peroxidase n=1 Tax=Orchesella cincta TaxID=48709 RepID=A0A1D2ND07_ORCCI|nr:Chorion peroxidase [Orchesella cincta]
MRSFIFFTVLLGTLLCFTSSASVDQETVDAAWEEATRCYQEKLLNSTIHGASSRAKRHTKMTPDSEIMSENSNIYGIYEDIMMKRHNLTKRQAATTQTPAACQIPGFNCNGANIARYRNVDGTCNNLNNALWGARNRAFNRVAQVAYEDGANVPRGNFQSYLANPRVISTTVHFDSTPTNPQVTNMVPQFGQFLDHDITMTPEANSQCCSNPRSNVDCWSIPIPTNDVFYSRLRSGPQRCMDFTRSTTCNQGGIRQQVNTNTAYIDCSQIYGSDPTRTRALRSFRGGQLVTNPSFNGFLPSGSQVGLQVQGLFAAGDDRINEMPGLAVMHNVFLMEHNRIAREFAAITGSTNDELIFQETKRVVCAMMQNIVYSEYLPIVLGPQTMAEYNLNLPSQGYSSYSANVDATIINSFATAAYRFGHSMIAGIVRLMTANNGQAGSYSVGDHYFQSGQVTQSNGQGYDMILRSLFTQNAPAMDRFVTTGVTNFLFKQPNADFGSDLVARNIQRGRDHGLPSYNTFRQLCGLSSLSTSWQARPAEINADGWSAVNQAYGNNGNNPTQIDFFTGGLIESPVQGGLSGPTFNCIKAVQFQRLKDGDRYFFTHNTGPYAFTQTQINVIRGQRLSDIVCRNSQQPDAPLNAFLVPSSNNPIVSCSSRPAMNLRAFT